MASQEVWERVSKYFSPQEFQCRCGCGLENMDDKFLLRLLEARLWAKDVQFVISSGCRCKSHNRTVGGNPWSSHLYGLAADIKVTDGHSRFIILKSLMTAGFNRFGIGQNFIHVDSNLSKPEVIWTYVQNFKNYNKENVEK